MFWWMNVAVTGQRCVRSAAGQCFLDLLLFLLYTSELFSILENKLIGNADDSTLMAVVPSPGARVSVAESPNRDLVRVNAWCNLWGMKLNSSKTKTMIVSRSRTMHPQSPPLTIDGTANDRFIIGRCFWGFCLASFGILFCSVVFGCRYTP